MKQPNRVKAALNEGRVALGYNLNFPSVHVIEILAPFEFDYVWFDGEHGPFELEHIEHLCRTAESVGVTPIARVLLDDFLDCVVDEVYVAYTDYVNTLRQRTRVDRLLPLAPELTIDETRTAEQVGAGGAQVGYTFEPDPEDLLGSVLPRFTQVQVFQAVLESLASEHSARMVAMRNATDNANELSSALRLAYNKARQLSITSDLLDIAGGAEALQQVV